MKTIFSFLFVLFFSTAQAQQPAIDADSLVLKLTITNQLDQKLETVLHVEDLLTHKIKTYQTSKEGKATCVISTAANYRISITGSADTYEYNIPDFAISPVTLTFKFTVK